MSLRAGILRFSAIILSGSLVLVVLYVAAAGGVGPLVPWQIAAAILSAFLTTAWLVLWLRLRQANVFALASLICVPSAAGFAVYAAKGGPDPPGAVVYLLVGLVYSAGLAGIILGLARRGRARPDAISLDEFDRRARRSLIGRLLVTAWLAAFLFGFEPAFAVAYIVVNIVWEAIWIPRRWRTIVYEHVADIAAPRQQVFGFISNTENWPRYRDDVQIRDLQPPGQLRSGTHYTARMSMPATVTGLSERHMDMHILVGEVVAGRSISSWSTERPSDISVTELADVPGGTRMTFRVRSVSSFAQASQGVMLLVGREKAMLASTQAKRTAKLKEILEGTSAQ